MKKNLKRGLSMLLAASMMASMATVGANAAGSEKPLNVYDGTKETFLGSWKGSLPTTEGPMAGPGDPADYQYTTALFIDKDGKNDKYSNASLYTGTADKSSATVEINDSTTGHNGIILTDVGDYTIKDTTIEMITEADGSDTCDFSGKGAAVAVFGKSHVTIENSNIHTAGVATMPIFGDTGSTVTVKSSTLQSDGGTLYKEYMNSPDQSTMVAPPWILGIMGTSRTTNLMGDNSTMNFMDSTTSAGAWAVLSTDSGSNMYLNVYNTSLTLNNVDESKIPLQAEGGEIKETLDNPYTTTAGSGYGTYAIGAAVETFAGATLNVGTYATIFTGGSATYTNIKAGETYTLKSADGENDVEYTASESKVTTINSDTFGFMVHQSSNSIVIENGTEVNSGYATFLVKSGSSGENVTATIDNAKLNNGNGVLIQVIDNDDATTGGMMDKDDPANTNGGNMNFKPLHTEEAGFDLSTGKTSVRTAEQSNPMTGETTTVSNVQSFTFTNGSYTGNIYNASGSDRAGALEPTIVDVTLGKDATLTGAVASTSAIHVTYEGSQAVKANGGDAFEQKVIPGQGMGAAPTYAASEEAEAFAKEYQNTSFPIDHYFDIGQVANMIHDNGGNDINMVLTDNAVWYVDGTSVISSLVLNGNAKVVVPEGVTLTIDGLEYTNVTLSAPNGLNAFIDVIGSFTGGGHSAADSDYLYTAAMYIDGTGLVANRSNASLYTVASLFEKEDVVSGVEIKDSTSGHNGVIFKDAGVVSLEKADIEMITTADGTDTNDFSGKGTAVAVYGDSDVTIKDSKIHTAGVATMPVFSDDGATTTIVNSTLQSDGGTLHAGYLNSPDQSTMAAPPWILGIMGTSRCTNLEGNDTTMNVIDSTTSSGAWAVLSTDAGQNMYLNMYNTSLTLNNKDESKATPIQADGGQITTKDDPYTTNYGAGYGTYTIGAAVETFAGATLNVGTYATIFTGGTCIFTDLVKGQTYTLASADGQHDKTYTAQESKATVINSDTFGVMAHQGDNTLVMENGTVLNSGYTAFLVKTGSSNCALTADISDTTINAGNGVLVQLMDNDDATTGMDMATFSFITTHKETAGFLTEAEPQAPAEGGNGGGQEGMTPPDGGNGGQEGMTPPDGEKPGEGGEQPGEGGGAAAPAAVDFTFTDETLKGNIYNGGGYYGGLSASPLYVTLAGSTTLDGAIASTSSIHVTYEGSQAVKARNGVAFDDKDEAAEFAKKYQNTEFTISEYYDIGHVANMINFNGENTVDVILTDNAVWNVTSTSVVNSLTLLRNAKVVIPEGVTLTVGSGDDAEEFTNITLEGFKFLDDDGNGDWTWASDEIYACYITGIVSGIPAADGVNYAPTESLTRAQAAVLFAEALDLEDVTPSKKFSDDNNDGAWTWAADEIYACQKAGVISGYPDGTFKADATISRAEFATMMASALKLEKVTEVETKFGDDNGKNPWDWASGYIYACRDAGVCFGDNLGNFNAASNIKRSEAAIMMCYGFLAE